MKKLRFIREEPPLFERAAIFMGRIFVVMLVAWVLWYLAIALAAVFGGIQM